MSFRLRLPGLACAFLAAAAMASADSLVLRNGRRVEGVLIAVRGDTIEFEEQGEFSGRRTQRYDRSDVRRIELDDAVQGSSSWSGRDEGDLSRPGGLRERSVNVDARSQWTDTGVDLRAGQRIRFEAKGEVRWGPGRKHGPGGEGGSHSNPGRPLPNRPGASLIGRVGGGADLFFIGEDRGEIRVRSGGRLHLGINDDYLQDNSGSFQVTVYY